MITFKDLGHKGRLGNALFQAAATIALANRHGESYGFPMWEPAKHFNLEGSTHANLKVGETFSEKAFHYAPIPYKPGLNLYGYFQSEKYFSDCKDLIRDKLTPIHSIRAIPNTVSLHVRRGDYLKLSNCFTILDRAYYEKALAEVNVKKVLVFSEDMEWCKQTFTGPEFMFMEGNPPYMDIALQAACEHNIIANSSFSWWGAWLNKNPDKKVIAPKNWFGPELAPSHDIKDLIPEGWIRL